MIFRENDKDSVLYNYIVDDILFEELYEYEVNKDGFLYLVLDIKKHL
jgi:hypothetical protein